MDLIGSINFIEHRLGGRKPSQGKGKPAQKNLRSDEVDDRNSQPDDGHTPTEYDSRLGRKLDTTA